MPVLIAVGAFVMTLIGGVVAQRIGDRRHLVLGLAAGLMLGVVGFDLLPEALRTQPQQVFGVPAALLMFVTGFLALHIVERSVAIHRAHEGEYASHTHGHGHAHDPVKGVGLAAASALVGHSVMDGFAIGAAFQAGNTVGAVVAIAVISHDFADGFNTYTITRLYGNGRRRAQLLLGADALAPVAGAAVTLAFTIPAEALGLYLGFFAGFLLYLATSDILPEAHSPHPSTSTLTCTVAGAGIMWLVIGLAG
jgi:zinc transporter ZupT